MCLKEHYCSSIILGKNAEKNALKLLKYTIDAFEEKGADCVDVALRIHRRHLKRLFRSIA